MSAVLLRAFFRNGRRVQGKNILHKRIILRGIQAARLVMRQPGSLHRAALRQIPRVAEQVKLRRAEGEQQRKTADAKPQPARPEHVDCLLQKHFSHEIAHERTHKQKQQHIPEVIRRLAGKQLCHQCAEHQRAADREYIQCDRAQPADRDHVAAAFHFTVL